MTSPAVVSKVHVKWSPLEINVKCLRSSEGRTAVYFGFDNNRKTVDLFHVLQDQAVAKNVSRCWHFQAARSCRDCERVCLEHICIKQLSC